MLAEVELQTEVEQLREEKAQTEQHLRRIHQVLDKERRALNQVLNAARTAVDELKQDNRRLTQELASEQAARLKDREAYHADIGAAQHGGRPGAFEQLVRGLKQLVEAADTHGDRTARRCVLPPVPERCDAAVRPVLAAVRAGLANLLQKWELAKAGWENERIQWQMNQVEQQARIQAAKTGAARGFILKRAAGMIGSWSRRWISVEPPDFKLYDELSSEPKAVIPLSQIKGLRQARDARPFAFEFEVEPPVGKHGSMVFDAERPELLDQWMADLMTAILGRADQGSPPHPGSREAELEAEAGRERQLRGQAEARLERVEHEFDRLAGMTIQLDQHNWEQTRAAAHEQLNALGLIQDS